MEDIAIICDDAVITSDYVLLAAMARYISLRTEAGLERSKGNIERAIELETQAELLLEQHP